MEGETCQDEELVGQAGLGRLGWAGLGRAGWAGQAVQPLTAGLAVQRGLADGLGVHRDI